MPYAYLAYGAINVRSWEPAVDCRWAKLFYVIYMYTKFHITQCGNIIVTILCPNSEK